jgi:hypothetical protein
MRKTGSETPEGGGNEKAGLMRPALTLLCTGSRPV